MCAAVLLFGLIVAHPFVHSSFNDDWSYANVALRLAETGRIHYNGGAAPPFSSKASGALSSSAFLGFSFEVLRYATLPFSLGMVVLTYLLGRQAGPRRDVAVFGSLCLSASPLFIPLAATFMTEPYSCFFSLLCVYAAISCVESSTGSAAAYSLLVITAAGILGGSNRQTVWAAPCALIPYLAWVRRTDRRSLQLAAVAFLAVILALSLVTANFSQKYSPLTMSSKQLFLLVTHNALPATYLVISLLLVCLLMCLPALLCFGPRWKRIPRLHLLIILFVSLFLLALLRSQMGDWGLVSFAGNVLSERGILPRWTDGLGYRPVLLNNPTRYLLTFLLLLSLTTAAYCAVTKPRTSAGGEPNALSNVQRLFRSKSPRSMQVFGIFVSSYLPFLIPGAILLLSFDRYILPVLPITIIVILRAAQDLVPHVPFPAWLCLLVFGAYGVVTTYDYCASLQARSLAARKAELIGVPAQRISVGFEYDGWHQLQLAGQVGATLPGNKVFFASNHFWFWFYSTALTPEYVAVTSPADHVPGFALLNIRFTAWTPPFRRSVAIVRLESLPAGAEY